MNPGVLIKLFYFCSSFSASKSSPASLPSSSATKLGTFAAAPFVMQHSLTASRKPLISSCLFRLEFTFAKNSRQLTSFSLKFSTRYSPARYSAKGSRVNLIVSVFPDLIRKSFLSKCSSALLAFSFPQA